MSERDLPKHLENDNTPEDEYTLEVSRIFERLSALCDEIGYEFDFADVEDILGQDENDFLSNLATFAQGLGLDHEEFFERLGIDAEFSLPSYSFEELSEFSAFQQKVYTAALARRKAREDNES